MANLVLDPAQEELFLGIAYALFMNRLHVLRLTEIVRLGIKPAAEDGNMEVPERLDRELIQQSVDYVLKCFPPSFSKTIEKAKGHWLELA
jgi:hypothetical protein